VMSSNSGIMSSVSVLLGNGNGTFQAAQSFPAGFGPAGMAVGDFNRDGKPDLAVANRYSGNVLLGNGNGTFQSPVGYAANLLVPIPVAVGDFNRDGFPDLVVGDAGAGTVSVLINAADWSTLNSFAVSGFPSTTTAGTSASFTVTAKDGFGSALTGYTGTVHFSSND